MMGEDRQLREKYELSLDSRQVVSATIAAVVMIGAVFVLGVVVGRRIGTDQQAVRAPDLLSALDQKAALTTPAPKDPPLTFREVLAEPSHQPDQTDAKGTGLAGSPLAAKKPDRSKDLFTVQLLASQRRGDADRFAARLREKGYSTYIQEAEIPGKGMWYRVRLGSFPSREAANRFLQDFKRETRLSALVTDMI